MNKSEIEKTFNVKIDLESKVGRSYFYKITLPNGKVLDNHVRTMYRVEYLCTQYFKNGELS